MKLQALFV